MITPDPKTVALRYDSANSRLVTLRDVSVLVQKQVLGDRSAVAFSPATLLTTRLLDSEERLHLIMRFPDIRKISSPSGTDN